MIWILALALFVGTVQAQEAPKNLLMLDTGGHMALIKDIVFTPDGRQLVSASDDKTIRVWDLASGRTVRTIRGEISSGDPGKIFAMALSPDGKWLAAGGWTHPECAGRCGDIRLYDFASGRLVALLKGHENVVFGLVFSPDGRHLISGSGDFTAILWDIGSLSGADSEARPGAAAHKLRPMHRLTGHADHIYAVDFTPDGAHAVTGSHDHDLRLWRVADGREAAHLTGHGDKVQSLTVAPDGTIASGDWSGEIRLWDWPASRAGADGRIEVASRVLARLGTVVGSLSFSPDGKTLLSSCGQGGCSNKPQIVYDLASGREIVTYRGHDNVVWATAISADGRWAATGGGDNNEIHIWDLKTGTRRKGADGQPLALAGQGQTVWAAGFSEDGRRIGWGNKPNHASPNPKISRGPLQYALTLPSAAQALPRPFALAAPHPGPLPKAEGVKAAPPGEGERHGIVWTRARAEWRGWSLQHRKGGNYGYNAILDILRDGKSAASIERGPTDGYLHRSYSFTPDGETIISGSGNGVLTAYDRQGRKLPDGDFIGHEGDVWAVAPSPDGRYLVSGSFDQTVRLWNLQTRELLVTLFHGTDGEWVMWTPEGFFMASENGGKLVGWQINQGPDREARYVTAGQARKAFNRPDLVAAKIAGDPDGAVLAAAEKYDLDDVLAPLPKVEIVTPAENWQATEKQVTVKAHVTDQGGGVRKLIWRIDGKVMQTSILTRLPDDGIISETFTFGERANPVEVTASNRSEVAFSDPARITIRMEDGVRFDAPELYVLAIGADKYRVQKYELDYAAKDATTFARQIAAAGEPFYRSRPHVTQFTDPQVTVEKLDAAFAELGRKVKPTDVFIFYIAGHGKAVGVDNDYYFLPPAMTNFTDEGIQRAGFGPEQWQAWTTRIKASKQIWIYDTCDSGAIRGVLKKRGGVGALETAYLRLKEATGRTLLLASTDQQAAREGYGGHGVFTYALLESLAHSDLDGNGQIGLTEMGTYVERRVSELSRQMQSCGNADGDAICQRAIAHFGERDYPVVPRYEPVLQLLERTASTFISRVPTHVVLTKTLALHEEPAPGARETRAIHAGAMVTLVKDRGDWTLVAENGKKLGYIQDTACIHKQDQTCILFKLTQ